jgi:hypothetical protein
MERSELDTGVIDMLVDAGAQYGEPLPYPSYE